MLRYVIAGFLLEHLETKLGVAYRIAFSSLESKRGRHRVVYLAIGSLRAFEPWLCEGIRAVFHS